MPAVRHVVSTECEAESQQEAAGSYEWNHVGHAGHDCLLDALAPAELLAGGFSRCRDTGTGNLAGVWVLGGCDGLVDHLGWLIDRALDAGFNDWLASETLAVFNSHVGGEDDGVGSFDDLRINWGDSGRALSLHNEFHIIAAFRVLRQGIRSHVGVCDTGWACGDCHDTSNACRRRPTLSNRRRSRSCSWLGGFWCWVEHGIDNVDDFLLSGGFLQSLDEILLHQGASELGQDLQVLFAAASRCCNEEHQVGIAIRSAEVHTLAQASKAQGRDRYGFGTAVGDSNLTGDTGAGLCFTI